MPKIKDLSEDSRKALAKSDEIVALNRLLHSFQFMMIEHVRNAKDADQAKRRASYISEQIKSSLPNILGPAESPAGAASNNLTRVGAGYAARCPVGTAWDPVTETCV